MVDTYNKSKWTDFGAALFYSYRRKTDGPDDRMPDIDISDIPDWGGLSPIKRQDDYDSIDVDDHSMPAVPDDSFDQSPPHYPPAPPAPPAPPGAGNDRSRSHDD